MTAARCTGDILAQWYQLPESMQAGE
jgi:hypothetical protein